MGRIEKGQQSSMDKYMTPALNKGIEKGDSAGRKVTKGMMNLSEITVGKLNRIIGLLTTGKWMNNKAIAKQVNAQVQELKDSKEIDVKEFASKISTIEKIISKAKEIDPKLGEKLHNDLKIEIGDLYRKVAALGDTKEIKMPEKKRDSEISEKKRDSEISEKKRDSEISETPTLPPRSERSSSSERRGPAVPPREEVHEGKAAHHEEGEELMGQPPADEGEDKTPKAPRNSGEFSRVGNQLREAQPQRMASEVNKKLEAHKNTLEDVSKLSKEEKKERAVESVKLFNETEKLYQEDGDPDVIATNIEKLKESLGEEALKAAHREAFKNNAHVKFEHAVKTLDAWLEE